MGLKAGKKSVDDLILFLGQFSRGCREETEFKSAISQRRIQAEILWMIKNASVSISKGREITDERKRVCIGQDIKV